jgi:hypothetical protein
MGVRIPVGFGQAVVPIRHALHNKEWVITFGFDAPASPNPVTIANDIFLNITGTANPLQASAIGTQYTVGPVRVSVQQELGILSGEGTSVLVGTNAAVTQPPPQVAVLVQKRSGLGGRANRGRFYVPAVWIAEADIDNLGNLTTTVFNATQAQWNSFLVNQDTDGYGVWVLHSGFGAPAQVTALNVQRKVATQRRRLRP